MGVQDFAAAALYGLAKVAAAHGDITEARSQGQESLAVYEALGHFRTPEVQQWLAGLPEAA